MSVYPNAKGNKVIKKKEAIELIVREVSWSHELKRNVVNVAERT